jgi:hypothetical protein
MSLEIPHPGGTEVVSCNLPGRGYSDNRGGAEMPKRVKSSAVRCADLYRHL